MGRNAVGFEWGIVLLLLGLGSLGLSVLLTINPALFQAQLLFFIVSLLLLYFFSRVDPVFWWWLGPLSYVLILLILLASFWGPAVRGATRWIVVFGMQLQPSELVKPFLLLFWARLMTQLPPRRARYLVVQIVFFITPFFLVFRQPDLGTSIVYAASWLTMLFAAGLPGWVMSSGGILFLILLPLGWKILAPYQQARLLTFINPNLDPQGAGYNALQAMIAVGSGQLFGRGLGRGTQSHLRFLPEHHTDFIFATLVEELGLLGALITLLLYALLLARIIFPLVKMTVNDDFTHLYSVGLFALILAQVFINIGMNTGILPITGITLPFISYGGSSLLSIGMSFGILISLWRASLRGTIARTG